MNDTINIEKDFTIASKDKVMKMQAKMRTAFEELKNTREKIKNDNDNLKFLQAELKTFQDNYLSIFNLAPVAFFTIYEDLIIKELNVSACEMLCYNRFEILGKPVVVFAEPAFRDKLRSYYHKIFNGQNCSIEVNFVNEAGIVFPVLIQSSLVQEDNSSTRMCLSSISDLTKIKDYQQALEKEKKHIREMADKYTDELNSAILRLQEQQQDYAELTERFNCEKAQLKSQLMQEQKTIENLMDSRQELTGQSKQYLDTIEQSKSEIIMLNSQLNAKNNEISQLNQDILNLNENTETFKQHISALQFELNGSIQKISDLETGLSAEMQKSTAFETKIGRLKQKFVEEIKARNEKIAKAKEIISTLKQEKTEIIKQWENKFEDNERMLSSKNNELAILNEKLQSQLSSVRTELKQENQKSNWLDKKIKNADDQLKILQKELAYRTSDFENKIHSSDIDKNGLIEKLSTKSDDFDFLKEELIQMKSDYAKLEQSNLQLNEQIRIKSIENNHLSLNISNLKLILERLCSIGAASISIYNVAEKKTFYLGKHLAESLGYNLEQIQAAGENFINQIMNSDDKARISRDLKDFSWTNYNETIEVEYRLKDTHDRWHYINCQEMVLNRDTQNNPLEILTIQYNYTEKVETKKGMDALTQIMDIVSRNNKIPNAELIS